VTRADLEAIVLKALAEVAPEAGAAPLRADVPLRDQVDLDSFDFLNFVIAIHKASGVAIPESDYARLASVSDAVEYLSHHLTP
jgi:acyl carrier protein